MGVFWPSKSSRKVSKNACILKKLKLREKFFPIRERFLLVKRVSVRGGVATFPLRSGVNIPELGKENQIKTTASNCKVTNEFNFWQFSIEIQRLPNLPNLTFPSERGDVQ